MFQATCNSQNRIAVANFSTCSFPESCAGGYRLDYRVRAVLKVAHFTCISTGYPTGWADTSDSSIASARQTLKEKHLAMDLDFISKAFAHAQLCCHGANSLIPVTRWICSVRMIDHEPACIMQPAYAMENANRVWSLYETGVVQMLAIHKQPWQQWP